MKFWSSIHLSWGHFGFDVYWMQTDRQAKYINRQRESKLWFSFTKCAIITQNFFRINFRINWTFLDTGTSDITFMGCDQKLKWLAFSLFHFSFTVPLRCSETSHVLLNLLIPSESKKENLFNQHFIFHSFYRFNVLFTSLFLVFPLKNTHFIKTICKYFGREILKRRWGKGGRS